MTAPGSQAEGFTNDHGRPHSSQSPRSVMLAASRPSHLLGASLGYTSPPQDRTSQRERTPPPVTGDRITSATQSPSRLPSLSQLLNPAPPQPPPRPIGYFSQETSPIQDRTLQHSSRSAYHVDEARRLPAFTNDVWPRISTGPPSSVGQSRRMSDVGSAVRYSAVYPTSNTTRQRGFSQSDTRSFLIPETSWITSQSPQFTLSGIAASASGHTGAPTEWRASSRRLLGERLIPGEGRMFVYDDGSRVPTSVDGEPVNSQWGMTKAGRPRKRMPQACIPCRQKKVKCDPAEGKCVQCEKSGKDCYYAQGHRGQKSDPTSPNTTEPTSPTASHERFIIPPAENAQRTASGQGLKQQYTFEDKNRQKRQASAEREADAVEGGRKRLRGEQDYVSFERLETQDKSTQSTRSPYAPSQQRVATNTPGFGCWATGQPPTNFSVADPFVVEPAKARDYLQHFCKRVNEDNYRLFPPNTLTTWAYNGRLKARGELMVLNALLACGACSSLESSSENATDMERYEQTARILLETSMQGQCLEVVLTKLALAYVYSVRGQRGRLIEIADINRAASVLEDDEKAKLTQPDGGAGYLFNLNRNGLRELYLRTRWMAFMMDAMIAIELDQQSCIHREDLFLPLPCNEGDYERQVSTNVPYFDNGIISPDLVDRGSEQTLPSGWSEFLTGMSFVSTVFTGTRHLQWQSDEEGAASCDEVARQMTHRLHLWFENLAVEYQLHSEQAVLSSLRVGVLHLAISINLFYYFSHIALNRRVKTAMLNTTSMQLRMRAARDNAESLLLTMRNIRLILSPSQHYDFATFFMTLPLFKRAIVVSVDTLTACGHIRNRETCEQLLHLCETAVALTRSLFTGYGSYDTQDTVLDNRLQRIREFLNDRTRRPPEASAWVCRRPLDVKSSSKLDCFYRDNGGMYDVILGAYDIDETSDEVVYI